MSTDGPAFWLGAHHPSWLDGRAGTIMVSRRRMPKRLRPAGTDWVLDSGGFTELSLYGEWTLDAKRYAEFVRRCHEGVGRMRWAAPQDWMCEPFMLAKTGRTVEEHQRLTVSNFIELRALAPDLPIIPVLQGWDRGDYLRCAEMYESLGVDLAAEPLVGLGSVCRRQATSEVGRIVSDLQSMGLRLHGFGCKIEALRSYGHWLASADSMAWSFAGRQVRPCPVRPVSSCANCLHFALEWRANVIPGATPLQGAFW